ncbi:MAG: InlB B-repeat-containing protein, partial [Alphaproteobacteria bacterium]|nr:InlB B-repeat-containing protein [Alphaproteobacteria bacterium]
MEKNRRFVGFFAFISTVLFSLNLWAGGYTCPTYQVYTACESGYYMAEHQTTTSTLWYNVYQYTDKPTAGNKCIACPSQYSSFVSCPGGTKPPLYKISIDSYEAPSPNSVYVIYLGLDGKVYSDANAETEITSWTPKNLMGNRTFKGVYASSNGSGTQYITADGTFTNALKGLRPTTAQTFYANNTPNTYDCSAGQYLKCDSYLSCKCEICPGGKYCEGGTLSAPNNFGVTAVGITGTLPAGYYASGGASVENPTSCAVGNGECGSCSIYDDNTATGKTKKSDCTFNVPAGYRISTVGEAPIATAGNWWTTAHTVSLGDISEVNYCMYGYTINLAHNTPTNCGTSILAGYGKNTQLMRNVKQVRISTSSTSLRIKEFGVYAAQGATGTNLVSGQGPISISNGASFDSPEDAEYLTDGNPYTVANIVMPNASATNPLYLTWGLSGADIGAIKFQLAGGDYSSVKYPNIRIEAYDVLTDTWHTVYYNSGDTWAAAIFSDNSTGSIVSLTGPTVACGSGKYRSGTASVLLTQTRSCNSCVTLTGIDSSVSGKYSSVSPYNAATTCRFTPDTIDVPDNCATYTPNTVAYDGTAWDSSYYTATANYGYNVVNPTDSVLPVCTAKTTTISFDANGGTGGQTDSITGTYDSVLPTLSTPKPTKTGCKFMGWYDMDEYDDPDAVQYYSADGTPAVWDKIDYSATLYAGWLCDLAGTAKSVSQTYNGQPLSCAGVSGVTPSGATVTYSTDGTNFSTTIPTITNVSESGTVYYKISATDYTPVTGSFSCTVTRATIAATAADNTKTYDGSALTCDGVLSRRMPTGSTFTYGLSEGSYTLNSAPTITNVADSKTVYYQVTNPNYNDATGSFACTITKADMDITATADSQTYNGNPLTCDGNLSGVPSGSTINYGLSSGSYNLNSAPTITNVADSKTIYYQVTNANYNTKTGSFECTVNPADMNVTATADSQTYNGNPLTCDGNLSGVPSGSEIMYGTVYGSYTLDSAPTITNVADSTTIYYQVKNDNYNTKTGSFKCTVNPANMNVTATADSKTYNGSSLTCDGNLSGVPSGSEIMYG